MTRRTTTGKSSTTATGQAAKAATSASRTTAAAGGSEAGDEGGRDAGQGVPGTQGDVQTGARPLVRVDRPILGPEGEVPGVALVTLPGRRRSTR